MRLQDEASSAVLRSIVSLAQKPDHDYRMSLKSSSASVKHFASVPNRTRLGAHFKREVAASGCQLVSGNICSSRESRSRSCAQRSLATSARAARAAVGAQNITARLLGHVCGCETKAANS